MERMKTFMDYALALLDLQQQASQIPLGTSGPMLWTRLPENAPVAAIVTAHPDDESLIGMPLGLRFRRAGYRVVVIPATIGRPEQVDRRLAELQAACNYFGVELHVPLGVGLRALIKSEDLADWEKAALTLAEILKVMAPKVIITHQKNDGHHDHIKVHRLTIAAMKRMFNLDCVLAVGEYWRDVEKPNLQLEIAIEDVGHLVEGLSNHKGEVERAKYHVLWPMEMMVNARFGELVTGWGTAVCRFPFSVMYELLRWLGDGVFEGYLKPTQLAADQSIDLILPID